MKRTRSNPDTLSLGMLPRQGMRRKLRRYLVVALVSQAIATVLALALLQALRPAARPDHGPSIAALSIQLLRSPGGGRIGYISQEMLDRVAENPSVAFACVVDESDRSLLSSSETPLNVDLSHLAHYRDVPFDTPVLAGAFPAKRLQVYELRLPDRMGERRSILIGVHDYGSDRAVIDGVAATAIGGALTALISLPLVWHRVRAWSRGLHLLHISIRRLALSAPVTPLPVVGDDEIAYLSIAFNDMAGKLIASKQSLFEANQTLEGRVRDRTEELRMANVQLERQNVKLAGLTETALRFTDDVAHELRTPLTVVMEFASILDDGIGGPVTEQQREYLRFISDASGELARLVDDFLDSSKLRSGTLRVDRKSHRLSDILERVWPMLELRAASAHVALHRVIPTGLPSVFADRDKLARAVINLTINAIKFTRSGSVVTIAAEPAEAGVRISVTDQGPGLSPDEVSALFQRFKQTASGKASQAKGFGLGLSIVQGLVSLNLGTIGVESTPGAGSTFFFTVPSDDPEVVIDMYLANIRERHSEAYVGTLLVDCDPSPEGTSQLIDRLAPLLRPYDLQIPLPGAVLLLGETRDVSRWSARLQEAYAHTDDIRSDLTPRSIDVIASDIYPVADAKRHLLRHFACAVSERAA